MSFEELRKKITEKVFGFVIIEDDNGNKIVMDEVAEIDIANFRDFLTGADGGILLLVGIENTGINGIQYHWEIGGPVLAGNDIHREHYCKIRQFGRPEDKGVIAYDKSLNIAVFKAVEMILDGKYEE